MLASYDVASSKPNWSTRCMGFLLARAYLPIRPYHRSSSYCWY